MKRKTLAAALIALGISLALCAGIGALTRRGAREAKGEKLKRILEDDSAVERAMANTGIEKKNVLSREEVDEMKRMLEGPGKVAPSINNVDQRVEVLKQRLSSILGGMLNSVLSEMKIKPELFLPIDLESKTLSNAEIFRLYREYYERLQLFPEVARKLAGRCESYNGEGMEEYGSDIRQKSIVFFKMKASHLVPHPPLSLSAWIGSSRRGVEKAMSRGSIPTLFNQYKESHDSLWTQRKKDFFNLVSGDVVWLVLRY